MYINKVCVYNIYYTTYRQRFYNYIFQYTNIRDISLVYYFPIANCTYKKNHEQSTICYFK